MKINLTLSLIFFVFVSFVVIANISEINLIGCTELNGMGCSCHSLEKDTDVKVWVEGPDTLLVNQTGMYKMFMAGGPAEAGGYNVAGRFGEMVLIDTFSFQHPLAMNELTQAFSLPFPTTQDTIYWEFGYTASDSTNGWDTIYSCGLSLVWDSIPDFLDRWNFGPKFPVRIIDEPTFVNNSDQSPENFILHQNYPNPFNPSTKIRFTILESGLTNLKIYDILGDEVSTLVNEYKPAGEYEIEFNGRNLSSGIYIYQLKTSSFIQTKKMILMQ